LSTVAWISCKSSAGARAATLAPADSLMDDMRTSSNTNKRSRRCRLLNLVEEFVSCLTDAFQSLDLSQCQIRLCHEPAFCRYLVLNEIVFCSRVADSRPAFPGRVHQIQIIWNQRDEVVDVGVPIAIEGRGEEQFRVVVEEHEPHVVERTYLGRTG